MPYYQGPVDINPLTYRPGTPSPNLTLHPWIEIDLRYAMGHYVLDLHRERIPQGSPDQCHFGILSAPRVKALLATVAAPILDATGHPHSGLLPLTSTNLGTNLSIALYLAYLHTL